MTAPLVPADVDLRGLQFMPLDIGRLLDSDLFALSTGEEFKAAVALWGKSWQQVPASSVPDDDRVLSHLSGAGKRWKKIKKMALHGFIKCEDGRLYHPVVAEKALEAWEGREAYEKRQEHERTRQSRHRDERVKLFDLLREYGDIPAFDTPTHALRERVRYVTGNGKIPVTEPPVTRDDTVTTGVTTEDVTSDITQQSRVTLPNVTAKTGTGTETEIGTETDKRQATDTPMPSASTYPPPKKPLTAPAKARAPPAGERVKETVSRETWAAYSTAYRERYGIEPVRNAKVNSMLVQVVERLGAEEAPKVAAFFLGSNRGLHVSSKHCVDLLLRECEGLRTEWATSTRMTDTQARQADRTAATGNTFMGLLDDERKGRKHG